MRKKQLNDGLPLKFKQEWNSTDKQISVSKAWQNLRIMIKNLYPVVFNLQLNAAQSTGTESSTSISIN